MASLPAEISARIMANSSPPEACHGIAFANEAPEPKGRFLKEEVSDRVTQGIVDILEVVEIEQQQAHAGPGVPRILQGLVQADMEQRPVRQARQRVVVGGSPDGFLGRFPIGDVEGQSDETVFALSLSPERQPCVRAVGGQVAHFGRATALRHDGMPEGRHPLPVVGMHCAACARSGPRSPMSR